MIKRHLEMMKVVGFRRDEEWEMIAAVYANCVHGGHCKPQSEHRYVAVH